MRSAVLTGLLLALATAAGADIRWLEKDHDFGLMKEQAGPVTATSRFVNLGPDTVAVFSVRPSCGCTSADFSDAPVAPGDTAVISYTYDPYMRPGRFDKSVKVRMADGQRHSIRITGNVLGTPESVATLFPVDAGAMKLSDEIVNFGEVTFGRAPVGFINAYSMPLDSITPAAEEPTGSIRIKPSKPKAGPGDIVTYSATFESRRLGQYGPVEVPVRFCANPAADDPQWVTLYFRAFVLPDTQALALRQGDKRPVCDVTPDPVDLGADITEPELRAVISVTNTGSGPLEILRLHSPDKAISLGRIPKAVKPGKTARIQIRVDTQALPDGPFRIPLDLITDDPLHPHVQIPVAGMKK